MKTFVPERHRQMVIIFLRFGSFFIHTSTIHTSTINMRQGLLLSSCLPLASSFLASIPLTRSIPVTRKTLNVLPQSHAAVVASLTALASVSDDTMESTWSTSSAELEHALEVFSRVDTDSSGTLDAVELGDMLRMLDIDASPSDVQALFKYFDVDETGVITVDDFLPWYLKTSESAKQVAMEFQSLIVGRRTVDQFDQTPVDASVLRRAVQCAIAAPNRSQSEPWRFIQIGPKTVQRFVELKTKTMQTMETADGMSSSVDWTKIPGWCVVTTKLSPNDSEIELEDFKSTSCAVQNFMLSMWSEGIGTKWTSGPVQKTSEFAEICGVDTSKERVAGCIWYGFPTGGLISADPKRRKNGVDDVLSSLP
jgi:Ca2+-binding EF-hand superfamily protein